MRALMVVTLLLLTACGQKGQLFLPGPTSAAMPAATAGEPEPSEAETETDAEDPQARKDKKN